MRVVPTKWRRKPVRKLRNEIAPLSPYVYTCFQNLLSTNRPSFAAASQAMLTRVTNNASCNWVDLLQVSSVHVLWTSLNSHQSVRVSCRRSLSIGILSCRIIRSEMTMGHTFWPVIRDSRLLTTRLLQFPVRTTKWKCSQNQTPSLPQNTP